MTFGERIKEWRGSCGLTAKELGLRIGVSDKTIWRYESAEHEPPLSVLVALADFFGVTLDELVGRTAPKATPLELVASDGAHGNGDGAPTRIEILLDGRRFVWTA